MRADQREGHPAPREQERVPLRGRARREQDRDQEGDRDHLQREGGRGPYPPHARQAEAARPVRGTPIRLEEGHRHPEEGIDDRALRAGVTMPLRKYRPITPTQRFRTVATFEEVTRNRPEKGLTEHLPRRGG